MIILRLGNLELKGFRPYASQPIKAARCCCSAAGTASNPGVLRLPRGATIPQDMSTDIQMTTLTSEDATNPPSYSESTQGQGADLVPLPSSHSESEATTQYRPRLIDWLWVRIYPVRQSSLRRGMTCLLCMLPCMLVLPLLLPLLAGVVLIPLNSDKAYSAMLTPPSGGRFFTVVALGGIIVAVVLSLYCAILSSYLFGSVRNQASGMLGVTICDMIFGIPITILALHNLKIREEDAMSNWKDMVIRVELLLFIVLSMLILYVGTWELDGEDNRWLEAIGETRESGSLQGEGREGAVE